MRATLDTIRKEFGWSYASYWTVDPVENALVFSMESGRVDDEFQRLTRTARFREGEGLNGRSWRLRDLFHVDDVGELHDCCRAPLARRAGIRAAVALPLHARRRGRRHARLLRRPVAGDLATHGWRPCGRSAGSSSDKLSKLARQGELNRIKQMVDNAPVNMMYADLDLKVRYMNPQAEQTLKKLEAHLPVKVSQMIGGSIDVFHKAPEYQRRLLADPRNLPRTATINVGPELFELNVAAMFDLQRQVHRADDHLGGDHREGRDGAARGGDRGRCPGGEPAPAGAWGAARTVRDVITAALSSVREAFGWTYGSYWEVHADDQALRLRPGRRLRRRRVPPGDRRGALPRGRGAQRPGLAVARPDVRPRPGRDEDLLARPGRPAERAEVGRLLPDP